MLRPKALPLAAGLCLLAAVELLAQGGLGAPPGQMGGGGVRGGSSGRAPSPSGRIPEAAPPPAGSGAAGANSGTSAGRPERAEPSRPVGNILSPGSPGGHTPSAGQSRGFPGFLGQPNILSPGKPGPYRPGNVVTPGTPSAPSTGGISAGIGDDRNHRGDSGRRGHGRGHGGRGHGGVAVYPFVYFGYPYGYSNGGYEIETGAVSRINSNASYVIEGHLDQSARGRSRVYEVGTEIAEDPYAVRTQPAEDESPAPGDTQDLTQDAIEAFDLIALQGGLIYAVGEHWLLGNTVHFVTMQGDHYVVSLQEVDLDLSVRLNRERGRKFLLEVREQDRGVSGTDVTP